MGGLRPEAWGMPETPRDGSFSPSFRSVEFGLLEMTRGSGEAFAKTDEGGGV